MPALSNDRHELFAQRIAAGKASIDAYKAAFPESKTKASLQAAASRLLANPKVRARVDEIIAKAAERAGISAERVLNELARIGFADPRQVMSWDDKGVTMFDSAGISDDAAAAVAEVSSTDKGVRIKLHNKVGALEKLGQHLGLFKEKVEVTGANGGPLAVEADPTEVCKRIAFMLSKPVA